MLMGVPSPGLQLPPSLGGQQSRFSGITLHLQHQHRARADIPNLSVGLASYNPQQETDTPNWEKRNP